MDQLELITCNVGQLSFVRGSSVARCVKRYTFHDPGVEYMMRRYEEHLSPFFDIGANVGLFSFIAAEILGPDGDIVAFEPDTDNLAGLYDNIEARNVSNIHVVERAVSLDDKPLKFGKIDCGVAKKSRTDVIEIPCTSVDIFVDQSGLRPKFAKIDVEGAEAEVIQGAVKTLSANDTIVEMEFSYRDLQHSLEEMLDTFAHEEWDIECHLRDAEVFHLTTLVETLSAVNRVKHIETNQVFWPVLATTVDQRAELFRVLAQSNQQASNRKWEMLFTPKRITQPIDLGEFAGFEARTV